MKEDKKRQSLIRMPFNRGDPAGTRTQDLLIKSLFGKLMVGSLYSFYIFVFVILVNNLTIIYWQNAGKFGDERFVDAKNFKLCQYQQKLLLTTGD